VSLYVEILIRAPLDEIWRYTQTPDIHERWDLRFSTIEYLPRESESEPQRFLYATKIGFGKRIEGGGESTGSHEAGGARTSALKFWSHDPLSLIREGSGYWKYVPTDNGVRFLTRYDYRTRFGPIGRAFDRVVFRPLMWWATAWSFDRLRLWLEEGAAPERARRAAVAYAVSRVALSLVFIWHGLVPKLITRHEDEFLMLTEGGVSVDAASTGVLIAGIAEIALGLTLLILWRSRALLWLSIVLMLVALIGVAVSSPRFLGHAFNPVTLNLCVVALAAVGLILRNEQPDARRCRRRPSEDAAT
jgi:uncharacterized membrane protein